MHGHLNGSSRNEISCEVCNKMPFQAAIHEAFASCPNCGLARYCSDNCKDLLASVHSKENCSKLRLLYITERTQIDYHSDRQTRPDIKPLMLPSFFSRQVYLSASRYSGIGQYHDAQAKGDGVHPRMMYKHIAETLPGAHPMAADGIA